MPYGNIASFSGTARSQATVDWETDFAASPAVPKIAKFDINEGDKPPTVAQNLADDFNKRNMPSFCATPNGSDVVFTAQDSKYKVSEMRFKINNGGTKNLPGDGAGVPVGNTGLSVKDANG